MLYEIVNPSDPYTIEAHSLDVAFVACLLLGNGQYAFEPLRENGDKVPVFIFGGAEEWCLEHFGKGIQETVTDVSTDKRLELADCFDSCILGRERDRNQYLEGLATILEESNRAKYRVLWDDEMRSSMNDIGPRAWRLANKFRTNSTEKVEPAPRQVFTMP